MRTNTMLRSRRANSDNLYAVVSNFQELRVINMMTPVKSKADLEVVPPEFNLERIFKPKKHHIL